MCLFNSQVRWTRPPRTRVLGESYGGSTGTGWVGEVPKDRGCESLRELQMAVGEVPHNVEGEQGACVEDPSRLKLIFTMTGERLQAGGRIASKISRAQCNRACFHECYLGKLISPSRCKMLIQLERITQRASSRYHQSFNKERNPTLTMYK